MQIRELFNEAGALELPRITREFKHVTCVSSECGPDSIFVALKGERRDGHDFIEDAVNRGCALVVSDQSDRIITQCSSVKVANAREALAVLAGNLFLHPDQNLLLCGITGTSGKTTTSYLVDSILRDSPVQSTVIGTIRHIICGRTLPSSNTTPESYSLQAMLKEALERGGKHAVMEVSSHALKLKRVWGMEFGIAVFTNLTRDHMDFHADEKDYLQSKLQLFSANLKKSGTGIVNFDDPKAKCFEEKCRGDVLKYSMNRRGADIHPERVEDRQSGMTLWLSTPAGKIRVESHLKGPFNVYNIMAAVGAGLASGADAARISHGIESLRNVDGRFESVEEGQPFNVIVDYAHKPDAVEKVLSAARKITKGRLISVFGCGGDRDRGKRPIMGALSERLADFTILTSDNPRTEQPETILAEIETGMKDKSRYSVTADRAQAINEAVAQAKSGDTVVLMGKGHETYQIIGSAKIHFDDREEARKALKGKYGIAAKTH